MDKEQAIEKLNDIRCHVKETSAEEQALVMAIDALKQPVATDTNVGDKISKFIDGLEEIFADLRERHVDDSVCGLCEYDGAYMGQSGDWCNECPGFDRDDCFKLSDKTRKKWTEEIIKALPTVQPERKRGKWLADNRPGGGFWVCSCCKFPSEAFAANVLYKFCPNCGADMRGGEDEA